MELTDILSKYRIPYQTGGQHKDVRQGWLGIECPRCSPGSGQYYLGMHPGTWQATCWRCGPLKMGELLRDLTGEPWPVVIDWLESRQTGPAAPAVASNRANSVTTPKGLQPLTKAARGYLHRRRFDPDKLAQLWGVRSTGSNGRMGHRIWIPCFIDGVLVSWTTRAYQKSEALRYWAAKPEQEMVARVHRLYGQDYVRNSVVVCEGPTDVWAIGPGAVATLGLGCSEVQLAWLAEIPVRVICFDSEGPAQRRAQQVADALSMFPGSTHIVELETGGDPAEAEHREIDELRKSYL